MRNILHKKALIPAVFSVLGLALIFGLPLVSSAQNSGTSCNPPNFQITSSKDISAIVGESFTYFVVTENNTSYQLNSELPSGLSFADGRISGTPQTTGDYSLEFVASNDCGTTSQTIMLSVLQASSSSADSGTETAAAGQTGSADSSVRLNEIPDTGLSADQALTVTFYLLALLLISVTVVTRFTPTFATVDGTNGNGDENPDGATARTDNRDSRDGGKDATQVGSGIVRE